MSISREDIENTVQPVRKSENDVFCDSMIYFEDFNKYADEKEKEIEKLKEYTQHKSNCSGWNWRSKELQAVCTCGLDDLLNAETYN